MSENGKRAWIVLLVGLLAACGSRTDSGENPPRQAEAEAPEELQLAWERMMAAMQAAADAENVEETERLLAEMIEVGRKLEVHDGRESLAVSLSCLAALHGVLDRRAEEKAVLQELATVSRDCEAFDVVGVLDRLAYAQFALEEYRDAKQTFLVALETRQGRAEVDESSVAVTLCDLAHTEVRLNESVPAEEHFVQALGLADNRPLSDHARRYVYTQVRQFCVDHGNWQGVELCDQRLALQDGTSPAGVEGGVWTIEAAHRELLRTEAVYLQAKAFHEAEQAAYQATRDYASQHSETLGITMWAEPGEGQNQAYAQLYQAELAYQAALERYQALSAR